MVLIRGRVRPGVLAAVLGLMGVACTGADPAMDPSPTDTGSVTESGSPSEAVTDEPTSSTPPLSEAPSAAGPDPSIDEGHTEDGRLYLVAQLDAGSIADGAGDGTATGDFEGVATPLEATVELCYELEVEDLSSTPTSAQLRWDDPTGDDPVVADLEVPDGTTSRVEDCVIVDGGSAVSLFQAPAEHYVLVATQDHEDGAVRGQVREG